MNQTRKKAMFIQKFKEKILMMQSTGNQGLPLPVTERQTTHPNSIINDNNVVARIHHVVENFRKHVNMNFVQSKLENHTYSSKIMDHVWFPD